MLEILFGMIIGIGIGKIITTIMFVFKEEVK